MLFDNPKLTPYTMALLCQQAYKINANKTVNDWQFLARSPLNDYGYASVAYIHPTEKIVVIAHRGTDTEILRNLVSDCSLAFDSLPPAQTAANNFSSQIRSDLDSEFMVVETGHSLGAFHAEMNAASLGGYCISFESPGSKPLIKRLYMNKFLEENFISFFSQPNFIDAARPHVGVLYRIMTPHINEKGTPAKKIINAGCSLASLLYAFDMYNLFKLSASSVSEVLTLDLDLQKHQLKQMIRAIDPITEYPYLSMKVSSWPNLKTLLNVKVEGSTYSVSQRSLVAKNQMIETLLWKLDSFKFEEWLVPTGCLERFKASDCHLEKVHYTQFCRSAITSFDSFFIQNELRDNLINRLGASRSLVPAPSPDQVENPVEKRSLFFGKAKSATTTTSIQRGGVLMPGIVKKASRSVGMSRLNLRSATESGRVAIAMRSLIEERFCYTEKQWLVHLIKSKASEHVYLLIELFEKSTPKFLRADFFLKVCDSKTYSAIHKSMASLSNFVDPKHVVGKGFVNVAELNVEKYKNEFQDREYQSYQLTVQQGERLVKALNDEAKIDYTYLLPGNLSSSSSEQVHNCVTWSQKILEKYCEITVETSWYKLNTASNLLSNAKLQAEKVMAELDATDVCGSTKASSDARSSYVRSAAAAFSVSP